MLDKITTAQKPLLTLNLALADHQSAALTGIVITGETDKLAADYQQKFGLNEYRLTHETGNGNALKTLTKTTDPAQVYGTFYTAYQLETGLFDRQNSIQIVNWDYPETTLLPAELPIYLATQRVLNTDETLAQKQADMLKLIRQNYNFFRVFEATDSLKPNDFYGGIDTPQALPELNKLNYIIVTFKGLSDNLAESKFGMTDALDQLLLHLHAGALTTDPD
ncbi:hypothetical protein [Secundilactobacillus mixtipabuli]|uniref:Uncharacterized protein n=1 Tax=Secundilactobacillus mixtipabuli TaxID=1435342 RepID=A0A1Z5IA86_9LACO|nr:hypothetical protein [Secundilactobacillus mixtipabuli]GAW98538.1 hypothetical protein IWT30_00483 [Secundilactobacillus mixtipabuli]